MFFKKEGFPQESEIVVCTVTKIHYHSVFVTLNEYPGLSAMLHISEVSPGRIRNINDYVKVNKVIVCKVLRVDSVKKHIDVSLRRVNENQRREKLDTIKQEQKAEKIIELVAKEAKMDAKKLYDKLFAISSKYYEYLYESFVNYIAGNFDLKKFGLEKKLHDSLEESIKQRFKPPEVSIKSKISIECYEPDGVEIIKNLLSEVENLNKDIISVSYLGGGTFSLFLVGKKYEELEEYYSKIENMFKEKEKILEYDLKRV
ncbi:MAG: S1 RNA-binding domain-containing protein [Nanobdellota archaeon]